MSENRVKGYVIGINLNQKTKKENWVVKVKDGASVLNGKRLPVVSIKGDLALAAGLNVNFAIGQKENRSGQKYHVAVDVSLSGEEGEK